MSVIVTGGTGAIGYHLLSSLTRNKGKLISYSRSASRQELHLDHVEYEYGDILDYSSISKIIQQHMPTEIYHLATQSNVGVSHKKPFETLEVNILGTQNLLEAVRKYNPTCKVLLLSSSDIYGRGDGLLNVMHKEEDPYTPLTPFATSKASMELLGKQYAQAWGIEVVIARPFNYTGPGQPKEFVLPYVASQLVKIRDYFAEPVLYTGNLDVSRDFIDIRDLARALVLLMSQGVSGESFNICSGKIGTVRELVENMIILTGLEVDIRRDPARERAFDQPLLMGSPDRLMQRTGWKPLIDIQDSLKDTLHFYTLRAKKLGLEKENNQFK